MRSLVQRCVGCSVILLASTNIQAVQSAASPPAGPISQEDGMSGLPADVEVMLDDLRKKVDRQSECAELIGRSQRLYAEGEASYKRGDRKAGEARFARAQQIILATDEETFYEPPVHRFFLQLTNQIASLKQETPSYTLGAQLSDEASERVRSFVNYYQGPGRRVLRAALSRLGQFETMMRTLFREAGVPEDLIYVGLVESAYNPYALSPAGARGIWQFVRETGRRYGLRQIGGVDERHDPEKSTRAAARYLRNLYSLFGNWHLALAAYNVGERRIMRIVEKTGIGDFWQMSRRGLLPQETLNYVPSVLAAIRIAGQRIKQEPATAATGTNPASIATDSPLIGGRWLVPEGIR
ncbi:MAG: transglycosylase SLT domain-containing protein [Acidobacteria bacterium]|nr:transglycosylase SLT domain-containing protein [Acidobacteriota bacterium]